MDFVTYNHILLGYGLNAVVHTYFVRCLGRSEDGNWWYLDPTRFASSALTKGTHDGRDAIRSAVDPVSSCAQRIWLTASPRAETLFRARRTDP